MRDSVEKKTIIELVKLCYKNTTPEKADKLLQLCEDDVLNGLIGEAGVAGILNYYLSDYANIHLSDSTKKALKQHAGMIGIKNSVIAQQLAELAGELDARGLEYIVLKGIPLANTAYQTDSMRAVSDIDLLIKREEYDKVKEVLKEIGYSFPEEKLMALSERYSQEWVEQERSEILYTKEGKLGNSMVDVHFDMKLFGHDNRFNQMFPLDDYDWFGNTRYVKAEGKSIRCLTPQAELAHCIAHFAVRHSFMGIKWLIDICQARSYAKDLFYLEDEGFFTDNRNFKRAVDITLRLSDEIIGKNKKDSPFTFSLLRKYRRRLFEDPDSPAGKVKRKLYKVMLPVKISERVKFIISYLFEGDSIKHRIKSSENIRFDILQPFKLCLVYIREKKRQKKK